MLWCDELQGLELFSRAELDSLWDGAVSKVKAVVSEQFGAVSSAVSKGILTANDGTLTYAHVMWCLAV